MRRYTYHVEEAALSTATDLIRVVAAATSPVGIVGIEVSTNGAAADIMHIQLFRGTGGGTSAITAEKALLNAGNPLCAAHDLTGTTDTTASAGTYWEHIGDVRSPAIFQRAPEDAFWIPPSGIAAIRSDIDVTSVIASIFLEVIELG